MDVVPAGTGEVITDKPERTLRILTDHELLNLTWFRYEPGEEGPDPHVHHTHSDAFYVLEGEIEVGLGPEVESVQAGAGTLAAAPPNLVHTFRNSSDATAIFVNVHAPGAGFADMLRARRDGRDRDAEQFDQHDPPEDGGRPLADAVVAEPGEDATNDADGHFSVAKAELPAGSERRLSGVAAVFVLDGALAIEGTQLGPGDFAIATSGGALGNPSETPARCAIFSA